MANRDSLVGRLAAAISVLLAAGLVATITVVFWPRVTQALGIKATAAKAAPAYRTGDRVDVPAAWYRNAAAMPTLVIFGREACGACQQAQAFLKDLVANAQVAHLRVVFAGSKDAAADDARFAKSLGVSADGIVTAPAGLRVHLTPTLVLVSPGGRVINAWEGVGETTKRAEIARAVARAH
jgi:hypothetical protein